MDLHPGLWSAIAIQALVEGLRSATVFIPAAIGIQEAGYAAVAPVFGLPPEMGLAVSLLRRARDILVAVPVLLIWQLLRPAAPPTDCDKSQPPPRPYCQRCAISGDIHNIVCRYNSRVAGGVTNQ